MKVWTVVNQKGGVGKTTSAVSIAGSLSMQGFRVLLVDLDPHASLTYCLGYESENLTHSVFDVFDSSVSNIEQVLLKTNLKNVDLLPSHIALATLDKSMANQAGKGLVIHNMLSNMKQEYDVVIIDCPPVLGVLMINGLVAADHVIIPVQTEHLAIRGLRQMLNTIEQLSSSLQDGVKIKVIPTMFDKRLKACTNAYMLMLNEFRPLVWKGYIPIDTKFRDASAKQTTIAHIASECRGAFAYEKLSSELLKDVA